ncbi:sugar transferase [Odoribacter sp. Z80]|uniref:sugar transferase n=1 Tax=Odoribacter sp. Z80 TaxID=2304575 RepID=UPI00137A020C|nr:sugar transferase [Odoribacter sp. Z80]NCE72621.1 sugar transferase [Odoribacter sp. Z80]
MYKLLKYVSDVFLALLILGCVWWFLVPCMLILWCTGEHKVWYLQKRVGYQNRIFSIFKFATMLKNSPNMGTGSLTTRNDPRVLPFGRFLRKTKINELPQIFNVLNGTMSMVGPRPQMEVDFKRFPEHIQQMIYKVRPGITGIGSIVFRDEERFLSQPDINPIAFYTEKIAPYKGELEIWYQKHASLRLDLKLMFLTIWVIVNPKSNLPFRWLKGLPERPDYLK